MFNHRLAAPGSLSFMIKRNSLKLTMVKFYLNNGTLAFKIRIFRIFQELSTNVISH